MSLAEGAGGIEAELRLERGALRLEVAFALRAPWTVLFAPSGAGKSSVLRMLAGLLRPTAGRVVSVRGEGREVLLDTAAGVSVPAYRRGMGLVAQEPGLFPHMSAEGNVRYGARRAAGRVGVLGVQEAMRMCRVEHLAAKMPGAISGGESQRVALARALASGPERLLMLDEPFTGMDAELREALVRELQGWGRASGTPVLQVTHDVGDALMAEAEVLRMEGGAIRAQGPAEVVLREEIERLRERLR